jgi:Cu(I)/Ag(I) efflux system periplasmic protein CusF
MKRASALLFALTMWAPPHGALAQSLIDGQITKVDTSAGKITIKHGPIKKLGMDEGMTMVFKAQDPTMLNAVKAGDHVKFDADDVNGQLTLTKLQKAR